MTNSDPDHATNESTLSGERRDLLESLRAHRGFLRQTATGLTDEQARKRSTVSALTVGGLIRHVADVESGWAQFMSGSGMPGSDVVVDWSNQDPAVPQAYPSGFMLPAEMTLSDSLAEYDRAASATERLVAPLPDLDAEYPLPP